MRNVFSYRSVWLLVCISKIVTAGDLQVPSNANVVKQLCDSLCEHAAVNASLPHSASVSITILTDKYYSLIKQSVTETFQQHFSSVFFSENAEILSEIHFSPVSIRYSESFSAGIFSSSKTQREIIVEASFSFVEKNTQRNIWAGTMQRTYSDTIPTSVIKDVERNGIVVMEGKQASQTIVGGILEPFVIIFATGIAVYLFFTVRS